MLQVSVAGNIEKIEERIIKACQRSGRMREEITLLAVTKFLPIAAIKEAWDAGLRYFGESRVQEAAEKFRNFRDERQDLQLHLVGTLQRNKAKLAAKLFDCIQSLDREGIIEELAKYANAGNCPGPLPVLLELRTGEESKSGFSSFDDLYRAAELVLACNSLSIHGLMTMAPYTSQEGQVRKAFKQLAIAGQELEKRFPVNGNCCLSMGMSNDFEIAIEEGSTLLRIGSAIFGE
jgi:pyridoxal phosphate enzyme (YggS family)